MELKDKISIIQEYSSKEIINGASHNGKPLLKYVLEAFEEYFGYACKHCSSELPGYIKKLQSINTNKPIMSTKDRKYRMKSGSTIHKKGTNKYYSDLNITDEIAEELLKQNLNRAALFAKMPEGAIKRLKKERAEEEAAAAEAQAKAEQEEADRKAKEEAAQKEAEEAARKEAEAAQKAKEEQEAAEAQAKAEFEKAYDAGDLTAEQLDPLNMDEIKTYAKKHNYKFGSRSSKDDLVKEVSAKEVITEKE